MELVTIPQPAKRLFYQQMSIVNGWSVRQLRDQEDAMAYERTLIAAKPEDEQIKVLTTVTKSDITPDVILKSSYVVDFLGLDRGFSEEELLMLDEQNIKVAQYLTVLPEKQWFIDKLNRSILIARELQGEKGE